MGNESRHIPNNLKKYRRLYGYKQEEVTEVLGLKSANRISRWEKGLAMPSARNLFKLSILYSTLADQLYSDFVKDMKRNMSKEIEELISKQPHDESNKNNIKKVF
jgi:transcriptional regulator with XRE-family HTH domain